MKIGIHLYFDIKYDLEDEKIQIILEGVRNILLASLEEMEETDHFQIS